MRLVNTSALAAVLVGMSAPSVLGLTFFSDDFENDTAVTTWADTSQDADPAAPVIGPNWVVAENIPTAVNHHIQVVDHPTDLSGPPWAGGAGPTFDASATGGNQYLHMHSYPILNGYASAPIPVPEQANIAASGHLRLDVETYALSGVDGWNGGLRITGWNEAAGGNFGTNIGPRAFDVFLMKDGSVLNNNGNDAFGSSGNGPIYNAGYNIVPGLVHDINTWEKLTIISNFNTQTFSITLDGVTVGGLTWNGIMPTIQSVTLTMPGISGPRGGFDNFTLYEPEPASLGLLTIGAGMVMLRRRSRS